mgnify:CR=1 FL=1
MTTSPTLRLDGIAPALKEVTKAYEGLVQRALEYLDRIGVPLPEQPMVDGEPLIPKVPTGKDGPTLDCLDERGLSNLLVQFSVYKQYLSAQLAIAANRRDAMKEKFNDTEAQIWLMMPPPESTKKYRIRLDKRVKEARIEFLEAQAAFKLLNVRVDATDDGIKNVSREITLRGGEMDAIRRSENAGRKPSKKGDGRLPGGWRKG